MAQQIVRPSIPYRGCIPSGLHDGKLIEIRGSVPYGASVFEINLLTGLDPSSDRALHISVRFQDRLVVRNSLEQGRWMTEERQGTFPFSSGREFYLMILVEQRGYKVAVDHQHLFEFAHRIPMSRVTSLYIDGSVKIERIEFIDRQIPYFPLTGIPRIDPYFDPSSAGRPGFFRPGFPSATCQPPPFNPLPGVGPYTVTDSYPTGGAYIVPPPEQQPAYRPEPATVSSSLAPVYNPSIPYAYPIYGGLKPGMMVYISGRPSASAYKFTLNFQSGTAPYPPPDIAFHFDVRFFNRTIIRNSRVNNTWEREETLISHFPFQQAVNFDMIIRIEGDRYMIALNGQHFLEFRHRMQPLSRFDTLYIENDIVVSSIRFA